MHIPPALVGEKLRRRRCDGDTMIGWHTRALLLASLVLLSACTVEPPVGAPASRVTTSAPTISAANAPSTAPGDGGAAASATPVPARSTASAPSTTLTSPTASASHAITTVFLI